MPFLGFLLLLCRPIRMLVGSAFILGMVCIGLLAIIHPARVNSVLLEAAISAPK